MRPRRGAVEVHGLGREDTTIVTGHGREWLGEHHGHALGGYGGLQPIGDEAADEVRSRHPVRVGHRVTREVRAGHRGRPVAVIDPVRERLLVDVCSVEVGGHVQRGTATARRHDGAQRRWVVRSTDRDHGDGGRAEPSGTVRHGDEHVEAARRGVPVTERLPQVRARQDDGLEPGTVVPVDLHGQWAVVRIARVDGEDGVERCLGRRHVERRGERYGRRVDGDGAQRGVLVHVAPLVPPGHGREQQRAAQRQTPDRIGGPPDPVRRGVEDRRRHPGEAEVDARHRGAGGGRDLEWRHTGQHTARRGRGDGTGDARVHVHGCRRHAREAASVHGGQLRGVVTVGHRLERVVSTVPRREELPERAR